MCLAFSKMRNLDEKPYSQEEEAVAKYLSDSTGVGGGDDPVGCLIVSHRELVRQRAILKDKYPEIFNEIACGADGRIIEQAEPIDPDLADRVHRLTEGVISDTHESLEGEDLL